jgi:anti-sigma factor RsiW
MGRIIHLAGDPHQQTQALLPWYINGTLDENELTTVEQHLSECRECQADFAAEHSLGTDIASVPMDVDKGWAAMRARLNEGTYKPAPVVSAPRARPSFFRRSIPMNWVLSAQAAAAVLIFGVARLASLTPEPVYHTLSSTPGAASANLLVIFRPDTVEQDLRASLMRSGAHIVGGPTDSNAYVLHVADNGRTAALSKLRADAHVTLAEPIDGESQQ